jgi:hypothetical protein
VTKGQDIRLEAVRNRRSNYSPNICQVLRVWVDRQPIAPDSGDTIHNWRRWPWVPRTAARPEDTGFSKLAALAKKISVVVDAVQSEPSFAEIPKILGEASQELGKILGIRFFLLDRMAARKKCVSIQILRKNSEFQKHWEFFVR